MSTGPIVFHSKESKDIYTRHTEKQKKVGSRTMPHEFSDEDSNDEEIKKPEVKLTDKIKTAANEVIDRVTLPAESSERMDSPLYERTESLTIQPYSKFTNYKNIFDNLTKHQYIQTQYDIITMMISYDSTKTIAVTKKDDTEYYIRMFDLETYKMTFSE